MELKVCLTCKESKSLIDFYNRSGARKHERQAVCIECSKAASNHHKRFIGSLVKRWKMFKGCSRCNFKAEHSCQLDLDHIVPKLKNNTQAINTSWSKKRLKLELSQCQILCANCHRLKTFQDGTMFQRSCE